MRGIALGVFLAAQAGACGAQAQNITIVAPVFGQIVALAVPEGFASAYEKVDGGRYIHEFLPAGETLQQWTQMITVTGRQAEVPGDPVEAAVGLAEATAQGFADYCPGQMVAHQYKVDGGVRGAASSIVIYLGCPAGKEGGSGEAMVMVVAAGDADLYTLQWAQRFDAAAQPDLLHPLTWTPQVRHLIGGSMLCDRVPGEEPPYPSCTE